jgi:hypothetical protein
MTAPFASTWTARILPTPPLIAPARQFTYPQRIAGEDDAMARGALLLDVKPAVGANFLATCALGFRDPALPSGVFACPARMICSPLPAATHTSSTRSRRSAACTCHCAR